MNRKWRFILAGLTMSLVLGTLASQFASSRPDGLEKVGETLGFTDRAAPAPLGLPAPAPDYAFPLAPGERSATAAAGFAGTLAVFAAGAGLSSLLTRRGARTGPLKKETP